MAIFGFLSGTFIAVLAVAGLSWWLQQPMPEFKLRPFNYEWQTFQWFGQTKIVYGEMRRQPARDDDPTVQPFRVSLPEEAFQDLRSRVANSRGMRSTDAESWDLGVNIPYLDQLLDYLLSAYDWRAQEKLLNKFPQFTTDIDGLNFHFVHVRGNRTSGRLVVPILLLHGWPGSFFEFYHVIGALTEAAETDEFVFDVVVPSLPGFIFSEAPARTDLGVYEVSVLLNKLMDRLGYVKYYVHGGDIGVLVGQAMAQIFPKDVIGLHITMYPGGLGSVPLIAYGQLLVGLLLPSVVLPNPVDQAKVYPLGSKLASLFQESGYIHQQMTRPDSLGYALAQSPVSIAAWLVEKYYAWSDTREGFSISKDELLTTIILYWMSNSIGTSVRWYYKFSKDPLLEVGSRSAITIPVGYLATYSSGSGMSLIETVPIAWTRAKFLDLVSYNETEKGGHFIALEAPEKLVADIRLFVSRVQKKKATNPS